MTTQASVKGKLSGLMDTVGYVNMNTLPKAYCNEMALDFMVIPRICSSSLLSMYLS